MDKDPSGPEASISNYKYHLMRKADVMGKINVEVYHEDIFDHVLPKAEGAGELGNDYVRVRFGRAVAQNRTCIAIVGSSRVE